MIKRIAIISNILLVIGFVALIMSQLILAITMFVVSLMMSLVLFNGVFRERRRLRMIINISFVFVLLIIGFVIISLYKA